MSRLASWGRKAFPMAQLPDLVVGAVEPFFLLLRLDSFTRLKVLSKNPVIATALLPCAAALHLLVRELLFGGTRLGHGWIRDAQRTSHSAVQAGGFVLAVGVASALQTLRLICNS